MKSYLVSIARGGIVLSIAAMFLATTGAQAGKVIGLLYGVSETIELACYPEENSSDTVSVTLHKSGSISYRRGDEGGTWRFPERGTTWYSDAILTGKQTYKLPNGNTWDIQLSLNRVEGVLVTEFYLHDKTHNYRPYRTEVHVCAKFEEGRRF